MTPTYEKAFVLLSSIAAPPTQQGREQFSVQQSRGVVPTDPDPYYHVLCLGKRQLDFLTSEYYRMWRNGGWWGFYQLWLDWIGKRWILPLLCKWWPGELPVWLTEEKETR